MLSNLFQVTNVLVKITGKITALIPNLFNTVTQIVVSINCAICSFARMFGIFSSATPGIYFSKTQLRGKSINIVLDLVA